MGGREGIADFDGVVTLVTVAAAEKDTKSDKSLRLNLITALKDT